MTCNGKYTGGGMIINPYACINDGMVDITWISDPRLNNLGGVSSMLGKAKDGGVQAYDQQSKYVRGKKIVVSFKGKQVRTPPQEWGPQMFGIDGEDMFYRHKITWDAMKGNLEVCFDSDSYFREYDWFTEGKADGGSEPL
jgi:diacylglycerol kinase family enzyme